MKKIIYTLVLISLTWILSSCNKKETEQKTVPENTVEKKTDEKSVNANDGSSKIDLDFSKMNYNMISSITFEMLVAPENYENKNVKITGDFYSDEHEGRKYYTVLVWDATGCCPAGLTFIPTDSVKNEIHKLTPNEKITVTGKMKLMQLEENMEELILIAEKIELGE